MKPGRYLLLCLFFQLYYFDFLVQAKVWRTKKDGVIIDSYQDSSNKTIHTCGVNQTALNVKSEIRCVDDDTISVKGMRRTLVFVFYFNLSPCAIGRSK